MKITPELIQQRGAATSPLGERLLDLRGLKIPGIRNLGVTADAFDSIDLSQNEIQILGNFPKMHRITSLILNDNEIVRVDGEQLAASLPNLRCLVLAGNKLTSFAALEAVARLKSLEILILQDNPISLHPEYRAYLVGRLPNLRLLDFVKVTRFERKGSEFIAAAQAGEKLQGAEKPKRTLEVLRALIQQCTDKDEMGRLAAELALYEK